MASGHNGLQRTKLSLWRKFYCGFNPVTKDAKMSINNSSSGRLHGTPVVVYSALFVAIAGKRAAATPVDR